MLNRCHNPAHPTYIGCQVDERWKYFMAFRIWHLEQAPKRREQLDKDFLGDGKLYSPETCCFIPWWLNLLFNNNKAQRGDLPQGVHKIGQKFGAQLNRKGEVVYLGSFDTPEEARAVYLEAKAAYVERLLFEFPQPPRIDAAFRRKMTELIQQETHVHI